MNISEEILKLKRQVYFLTRKIATGAGGGGTWGSITGTLSDQTDLQSALDSKADGTGTANGTNTGDETTATLGATINGASAATPNNTDLVATVESSVVKKITWTNVKAFLKTYFDTLYQAAGSYLTTTLASAKIIVGNASNVATAVTMTGDGSISNTGVLSVENTRAIIRNETGSTIATTRAVYVTGFNNFPLVALADNTDENKRTVIGYTVGAITTATDGTVAVSGTFDAETNSWPVGTELYLGTAGQLVTPEPTSGTVIHAGIVVVQQNYPVGKIRIYTAPEANMVTTASGEDAKIRLGDSSGSNKLLVKDYADATVFSINSDGKVETFHAINESKWTDIASATNIDLGAANGNYGNITGTNTITSLGTVQAGTERKATFTGILTLTYNATSLILPTAANITTAASDVAMFVSLGSGNWKCIGYTRADGTALVGGSGFVSDTAYGSGWNGDTTTAPSKNAVYDKIETLAPLASPTFTGTVTTPAIIVSSETASRVAIIDASKNVKSADTATYPSLTELSYVKGLTSAAQTQINNVAVGSNLFLFYNFY